MNYHINLTNLNELNEDTSVVATRVISIQKDDSFYSILVDSVPFIAGYY